MRKLEDRDRAAERWNLTRVSTITLNCPINTALCQFFLVSAQESTDSTEFTKQILKNFNSLVSANYKQLGYIEMKAS